jgi:hypothetical protein
MTIGIPPHFLPGYKWKINGAVLYSVPGLARSKRNQVQG